MMGNDEKTIEALKLGNLARLAQRLGTSPERLRGLAKDAQSFYKPFDLSPKPQWFSGKATKRARPIDRPVGPLLALQAKIHRELLQPILMPKHIFGAVPRRTIFANAECHRNAPLLVTLDIKQCFPSITPRHVYGVWSSVLGCSPEIAGLLTKLTTFRRRLPQGAPTSPALANLLIWSVDEPVRNECKRVGVVYSTWLDDLAFSGVNARGLIQMTIECFRKEGLRFSHPKVRIMGPKATKTLTGTCPGRRGVRIPKTYTKRVRAGIHNLAEGRVPLPERQKYVEQLLGRLRYVHRVCPADSLPLRIQIRSILDRLPSESRNTLAQFAEE